ncbi:hypothetical protein DFO50_1142 [Microvirgula sp. AG722]|nr:hypothetical protein DFO50_1142 [Microvirgula sp. AG722]
MTILNEWINKCVIFLCRGESLAQMGRCPGKAFAQQTRGIRARRRPPAWQSGHNNEIIFKIHFYS